MTLRLSQRARADIADIARYTIKTWGEAQADEYVGGLSRVLEALAANQDQGRHTEGLPPTVRRIRYGTHYIFFERMPQRLLIVRVLHQSMDIVRHLR